MDNIVLAPFSSTGKVKTRSLYRYDYGQVLKITGVELPASYIVHFSNEVNGYATTAIGNADGVAIPDEYLQSEKDVYAWLFLNTGADDGETVFHITIPVTNRAKPTDAHPTPVQQDAIAQAIAALNEALNNSGNTNFVKVKNVTINNNTLNYPYRLSFNQCDSLELVRWGEDEEIGWEDSVAISMQDFKGLLEMLAYYQSITPFTAQEISQIRTLLGSNPDPGIEEPVPEDPSPEEPVPINPSGGEPAVEEPAVEEP